MGFHQLHVHSVKDPPYFFDHFSPPPSRLYFQCRHSGYKFAKAAARTVKLDRVAMMSSTSAGGICRIIMVSMVFTCFYCWNPQCFTAENHPNSLGLAAFTDFRPPIGTKSAESPWSSPDWRQATPSQPRNKSSMGLWLLSWQVTGKTSKILLNLRSKYAKWPRRKLETLLT